MIFCLMENAFKSTINAGVLNSVSFCKSSTSRFSSTKDLNGLRYNPVSVTVVLSSLDKYVAAFFATKVCTGLNCSVNNSIATSNKIDATIQRSIFNSFLIVL